MFKERVMSAVILVVLALAIFISGGYVLATVSLVLSLIAYRELMKACKLSEKKNVFGCFSGLELFGYISIFAYYLVMVLLEDRKWLLISIFGIMIAFMIFYVFRFPNYTAREIMLAFFCLIYGPLSLTFIYMTRMLPQGAYLVWMILIGSWISDTFAYLVGMLIGKHKLAPVLSPKKSIEGAVGGVIGAGLVGMLYGLLVLERYLTDMKVAWVFAIIAMISAVISQIGDLAASGIKRNEGIKDYGNLIPGHGGIMDRFDSVIFVAPMVYILCLLMIY